MKKKVLLVLGMAILLFASILCFTACDDPKPKCECTIKVHEGNCPAPCPGKGKSPCTCTDPEPMCECPDDTIHYDEECPCELDECSCEIINTPATVTLGGEDIAVERAGGVSVQEVFNALPIIQQGFNDLELENDIKEGLVSKIVKVTISDETKWEKVGDNYELSFVANINAAGATENFVKTELDLNKCICPTDEVVLIGEGCDAKYHDANIEVKGVRANVPGKATDGIAITNREDMIPFGFEELVRYINTALNHNDLSSEDRQNFIKNGIKEITIVMDESAGDPVVLDDVLWVKNGHTTVAIRRSLRTWCEENDIVMLQKRDAVRMA